MFDFAWSEIAVIAAVALLAIGPKDMPVAIRTVASMIKKARRMASEFQTHVDEMVREANLEDVRNQINEIRNFDVRGEIERHVDPDGDIRDTLTSNPFEPGESKSGTHAEAEQDVAVGEAAVMEMERPPDVDAAPAPAPAPIDVPAFIPPNVPLPEDLLARQQQAEEEPQPPAFIPPEVAQDRRPRHPA